MGILNRTVTQHITKQEVTAKEISELLTEKMGEGYKVEFKAKGNLAKQALGGRKDDSVLVIKNAYHRFRISVMEYADPTDGTKEYLFMLDDSEVSPFLRFIGNEIGFIGGMILGAIYGKSEDFYDEVYKHLKEAYNTEVRKTEVGLNALLGKNK